MAKGTILVHMGTDPSHSERLKTALLLAHRMDARLDVAYVLKPAGMPAAITGRGASAAFISEAMSIAREKSRALEAEVAETCRDSGLPYRWTVLDGELTNCLIARSHYAEVLIVSENHGISLEDYIGLHNPEDLLTHASCPVLTLPRGCGEINPGLRPMIAWRACREAALALRGALPLLRGAEEVAVLNGEEDEEIIQYLRMHGVPLGQIEHAWSGEPGEEIVARAKAWNRDIIVMGAYGKSRWRELLLGGTTHTLLSAMPLPLLTSH